LLDKNHYIKFLGEDFPKDFFSGVEKLPIKSIQMLYLILKYEKCKLGEDVFKKLKKIIVYDFEGREENYHALYDNNKKILEINSRFYGEDGDKKKELYDENGNEYLDKKISVTVFHELWHYYINEYNLKYIGEDNRRYDGIWDGIIEFYKEYKEYILGLFLFIDSKENKTNKNIYSEELKPEEFIAEAFAYLKARILYDKIKESKSIEKFRTVKKFEYEDIKDIYDSYSDKISNNLLGVKNE